MGMQLIETVEVGAGGVAAIQFTDIPQDGIDLICLLSGHSNGTLNSNIDTAEFKPNNTSFLSGKVLQGTGTSVTSFSSASNNAVVPNDNVGGDVFGSIEFRLSNYTGSSLNKSATMDVVTERNDSTAYQRLVVMRGSTTAVTSLTIQGQGGAGGDLAQYTTASLYKITAD
jgi:hypothetical protein